VSGAGVSAALIRYSPAIGNAGPVAANDSGIETA
jgi:hypothetical protein